MKVSVCKDPVLDTRSLIVESDYGMVPGAEEKLSTCVMLSADYWVGYVDNVPACVWGVIPPTILSNRAYLWLLTTKIAAEHKFMLVRHSQKAMENLLLVYDSIHGHCRCNAADSIRWVKWLGAQFGESEDGFRRPFVIRRQHGPD